MSKDPYFNCLNFLSLMKKAGKIKTGEFAAMEAVKTEEARLVIIAEDASENTKKRFGDKASYREIPIIAFGTKESLGRAIGKDYTASIAVLDDGMAKAFKDKYKEITDNAMEVAYGKNESV